MKIVNLITKSISAKLIVLFLLVSLLPVTIVEIITYSASKQALDKSIETNMTSVLDSRANHIENFITVSLDVVTSASSLSLFRDNLYNINKGINVENSSILLEEAMDDWASNSHVFYRAKILNINGNVISSTKKILNDIGEDRSETDYFKKGLKGPYVSDPYISPDDQVPVIAYSCPIYSPFIKNEVIGVLVIHQATEAKMNKGNRWSTGLGINEMTTDSEGMGESGETYIVNKDGLIITTSRFGNDYFLKSKVSTNVLDNLLSGFVGTSYKDYRGVETVGKATKIGGTDWIMIIEYNYNEAFASVHALMIIMLLVGLIVMVFVLVFAYFVARYFTKPIIYLTDIAQEMAKGDMNQSISVSIEDEIGQLADSFNTLQKTMLEKSEMAKAIADGNLMIDVKPLSDKDTMGQSFQLMVEKLSLQLRNISEGINVLASSSSEIMASVSQLASSSAETATSISETTTTVEEVKQTAIISNHKAKAVSENALRMAEISKDGNKAIANTIEGMNRIKQQMNAIAGMVVKLSEQSQTIGEITATVTELAEQSNLLAVNAAIEAAKAGEQGKGFTVVAQEIKILANRSKEATAQVRNILRDVQKSISSTVMATEEGGKAVEEGLKLTNLSGDTIKVLTGSVVDASNAAIQIAASSQQQLEGMDQMVTAMENIREASIQSVASTQQSVDSVNELQKVGQKLDEMMKQYKLKK
ncbi:MAG: methyl-accepting chemotaxis protein [Bacteroidales bacterium]